MLGNATRRSVSRIVTAIAVIALGLTVSARPTVPARAADAQGVSITAAVAQAEQSGQPVVATAETTETTTIQANPDGTLTATVSSGPVQEPDLTSLTGWSPIDLTLQSTNQGLEPAVSAVDTVFSDGGAGALAWISDGSNVYAEGWASSLPDPIVSGYTATYPDVLPGVDLTLQAQPQGFEQGFVVDAPPIQPLVLDVPLSLRGLTAQVDDSGQLVVTDPAGNPVAAASAATMSDAAIDPHTGDPVNTEVIPTAVVSTSSGPVLRTTPNPAFFTDPAVTYPVTIDPSPNLSVNVDTFVSSNNPTSSFATDTALKLGTPDGSGALRTLISFAGTGVLSGTHVLSATLMLYETSSYSCTGSEVDVYDASASWDSSVTWNTQPSAGTLYASATEAHGYSSTCHSDWISLSGGGASGHTLTDLVQNWANGSTDNGIIVKAASETDLNGWKKFKSSEAGSNTPYLSVTYNSYPATPADLLTEYPDSQAALDATFSDPEGGTGEVLYTIYDLDGNTVVQDAAGSTVSSGSDSPYPIPSGLLTDGDPYTWTARSYDGIDYSSATAPADLLWTPAGAVSHKRCLALGSVVTYYCLYVTTTSSGTQVTVTYAKCQFLATSTQHNFFHNFTGRCYAFQGTDDSDFVTGLFTVPDYGSTGYTIPALSGITYAAGTNICMEFISAAVEQTAPKINGYGEQCYPLGNPAGDDES
jgi:hypothetical protein